MPNIQIRTDMFPAVVNVIDADGKSTIYDKARVILTLDHMYVFQDANPTPAVVFEDRLISYNPPISPTKAKTPEELYERFARFETEDFSGTFMRASGCGCGSRLKTATLATLFPEELAAAVSTKDKDDTSK